MLEILQETLFDSIKLIPFLLVAFILMEYIEHKISKKNKKIISKSGKYGPFIGGLLGAFPQCGFSVAATNLYAGRIITLGTLISIYLSTSDEMLPILLSEGTDIGTIFKIIGLKVLIGMISGLIIDYVLRNKKQEKETVHEYCHDEHCDCEHSILKSSIKHTLNIYIFIFIISLTLNILLYYVGEENLSKVFMKDSFIGPFIASFVGLIPNCGSSVVITELYINGAISFGSTMAGLLTGSGIGLLILFKVNKNTHENINTLITLFLIGSICGVIIDLLGIII